MSDTTKTISIPLFVSDEETKEKENQSQIPDSNFGYKQEEALAYIEKKVQNFKPIRRAKRNKNIETEIVAVETHRVNLSGETNEDYAIIVKAKAHTYGQTDRIIKTKDGQEKPLAPEDKVGSDKFFFLIYPYIYGEYNEKLKWVIVVYVDPDKETQLILRVTKLILKNTFNIYPKHIKPKSIVNEIKRMGVIPILNISFEYNEDDESITQYFPKEHFLFGNLKKVSKFKLQNIQPEQLEKFLDENIGFDEYDKRKIKVEYGKKQIKIEDTLEDRTIEEIFNFTTEIDLSQDIYNIDYIASKLEPVLKNYTSSYGQS